MVIPYLIYITISYVKLHGDFKAVVTYPSLLTFPCLLKYFRNVKHISYFTSSEFFDCTDNNLCRMPTWWWYELLLELSDEPWQHTPCKIQQQNCYTFTYVSQFQNILYKVKLQNKFNSKKSPSFHMKVFCFFHEYAFDTT